MGDEASAYKKKLPSMLPLHHNKMQGLWETGRKGCHWQTATNWVLLRDMWMEEKAEAVQEQGLQRRTPNLRVLPRENPSMGDEESEYKKQLPSMLSLHNYKGRQGRKCGPRSPFE